MYFICYDDIIGYIVTKKKKKSGNKIVFNFISYLPLELIKNKTTNINEYMDEVR